MSAPPLRVLMTLDGVGGVFNYSVELIRALRAQRVTVSVVAFGPRLSRDQRELLRGAGAVELRETRLKLEWMDDPWRDLRRAELVLREAERQLAPDLIHANAFFCGALKFDAPVVVVAHSCVYSWWRAVLGASPPPAWERYRRLVSRGLEGADAVVAPTRAMLAALSEHYHAASPRMLVIPNGVHSTRVRVSKARFVLAAGRLWDPAKNVDALIGAARLSTPPILVAGSLIDPHGTRSTFEHPPNLRLLGRLPSAQLARLRARAPIFAAPARYEPFGLSILEAAADGCALVLGDIESLRETWAGRARFVAPEDHAGLAATLEELSRYPELAAELGYYARAHARELSAVAAAQRYASLYRSLVRAPLAVQR